MADPVTRPDGPLIWFHVPRHGALPVVENLIARLSRQDPALHFVLTSTTASPTPDDGLMQCHRVNRRFDRRGAVAEFLRAWSPDVAVWVRGDLVASQTGEIAQRGIPFYLIDATVQGLQDFRGLLATWRAKTIMRRFDRCLAYDEEAAQRLRALGAQAWRVEVTGPLEEGTAALPHDEEDRRDLADALATRPVWMAAHAPADEIAFLLEAHKEAVRRSHRYLLILHPNPDQDSAALAAAVREAGLSVALRSEVFVPEEDDQVLIADLPDERGLWYRVAPITYMGGTFANMPSHNPFEAASLGSAIIHGPNIARFRGNFDRLSEAQGTVALTAPGHLAAALNDLNFPDRAARLAHAAWDVSSSGAEVTDRVIALLKAALPQPRA